MSRLEHKNKSIFEVFDEDGISYFDEYSIKYFVTPDQHDIFKAMKKIGISYFALKSDKIPQTS